MRRKELAIATIERVVHLVLLLVALAAGLGAVLSTVGLTARGGMTEPVLSLPREAVVGLCLVLHAGVVLFVIRVASTPGDQPLMDMGRGTWLLLIGLSYLAGLSVGVIAYLAT